MNQVTNLLKLRLEQLVKDFVILDERPFRRELPFSVISTCYNNLFAREINHSVSRPLLLYKSEFVETDDYIKHNKLFERNSNFQSFVQLVIFNTELNEIIAILELSQKEYFELIFGNLN